MEKMILEEIYRGAESIIYKTVFLGIDAVIKYREPKTYMDPRLDKNIRTRRTLTEARILKELREKNIEVPALLYVDPEEHILVIEYIDGISLRDYMLSNRDVNILERAGEILGKIHLENIYHGDPTLGNYIVDKERRLWIIYFGLAGYSEEIEEKAVDLHLTFRSIETLPLENIDYLKKIFYKGYEKTYPQAEKVLERAEEIRKMGRYVSERKLKGVYRF